jgi:hypothetical protein
MSMKMRSPKKAQRRRRVVEAAQPEMPLPHERDETSAQPAARPTRVVKTAHRDVKQGLQDTDPRGVEALRAFHGATRDSSSVMKRKRKRTRP